MQNQINTSAITQIIQQVRSAELTRANEIKLSIQQARMLIIALAEIMDKVNRDYESMYNDLKKHVNAEEQVINVSMDGGDFEG